MDETEQKWIKQHTWRAKAVAGLRVTFGVVWAVAAWLKWQPQFQQTFLEHVIQTRDGQPQVVQIWLDWWISLLSLNPLLFARLEAATETALAILLISGLLSNLSYIVGMLLALGIWSVAEGFGGPYQAGQTTDIGTALPYALLFGVLFVFSAGQYYSLDCWLTPRLGVMGFLATGSFPHRTQPEELAI